MQIRSAGQPPPTWTQAELLDYFLGDADISLKDQVEQAVLLLKLTGEPQQAVAKMMGVTPSTFSRFVKMDRLEPVIKAAMGPDGPLGFNDSYLLSCETDVRKRFTLFEELISGKIAKGTLGQHVARKRPPKASRLTVAGVSFHVPAEVSPLKFLHESARKLLAVLKQFKAEGLAEDQFSAWVKKGAEHVA